MQVKNYLSGYAFSGVVIDLILVIAPILVLGIIGTGLGLETFEGIIVINLGYVFSILLGSWVLKRRSSSWREIGLARPVSWSKTILYGIFAFISAVFVITFVETLVVNIPGLNLAPPDISRFDVLEGNLTFLIFALAGAWTTIAFGEEMFYRAFLVTRLNLVFSSIKFSRALAIVVGGVVFGLAHFAEGPAGIASNGAFGILFSWIYLRSKQNLWITIIAHGLLNSIRFVAVFYGVTG